MLTRHPETGHKLHITKCNTNSYKIESSSHVSLKNYLHILPSRRLSSPAFHLTVSSTCKHGCRLTVLPWTMTDLHFKRSIHVGGLSWMTNSRGEKLMLINTPSCFLSDDQASFKSIHCLRRGISIL